MLTLIMICLDRFDSAGTNRLLKLLSTLFSPHIKTAEKKQILQNEYNIRMYSAIDKEVEAMCNLSEGVYEKGIEQGMEKGIKQGMEKGRSELLRKMIIKKISQGASDSELYNEFKEFGATEDMIKQTRASIN